MSTSTFSGVIYVMGVSGCGKSTVAQHLAERLGLPFCEADKLHPPANIERMSAGIPLTDADRMPWLARVVEEAKRLRQNHGGCVVACSALKKAYRTLLSTADDTVWYVFLDGSFDTILARMSHRTGHFMPDSLLQSQFDTLEDPRHEANVITVPISSDPAAIALQAYMALLQCSTNADHRRDTQ